jgi:hypothetical protein
VLVTIIQSFFLRVLLFNPVCSGSVSREQEAVESEQLVALRQCRQRGTTSSRASPAAALARVRDYALLFMS